MLKDYAKRRVRHLSAKSVINNSPPKAYEIIPKSKSFYNTRNI